MAMKALASMVPPPIPCSPRNTISWVIVWLVPARTEPSRKMPIPAM
jgi:hypothetical protein